MNIEKVSNTIKNLRNETLLRSERELLLSELLQGYPFWAQNVSHQIPGEGNRKFFRSQTGLYDTVSRMLPLPNGDDRIKSYGRANYPRESIMYCTDQDFYSCILELVERRHTNPQELTIVVFEAQEDFSVVPLGILKSDEYKSKLGINYTDQDLKKFQVISTFLDEEFRMTGDKKRAYLNSSVISHLVRKTFPDVDGIRYKTVQDFNFAHYGLNYALLPDRCKFLKNITGFIQYRFVWNESGTYQFQPIEGFVSENISGDKVNYKPMQFKLTNTH